jgi:UDP-N-acetylglucosamine 2-epimerase (non-hydrolysing)
MTLTKIMFVMGTRPEVIKLAPVIRRFRRSSSFDVRICVTGQHREMLAQALEAFDLVPDVNLELMTANQSLAEVTSRALTGLDAVYARETPSIVVVQGDTTTAMAGALAAFYRRIPIAHVEAGLRTDDRFSPFPEEINRRLIGSIADIHLAPTISARANLMDEGVPAASIYVTGNTAIDALLSTVASFDGVPPEIFGLSGGVLGDDALAGKRLVLVTAHRRESHAAGLASICDAIGRISELPGAVVLLPVHFNPNVRAVVKERLAQRPNVHLTDPLDYPTFSRLMAMSFIILTDSGGIQEEAPSLGKPVIVLRDTTERQEGIDSGNAILTGTSTDAIVSAATRLWSDPDLYASMAAAANPYGDGHASDRIFDIIASRTGTSQQMRSTAGA